MGRGILALGLWASAGIGDAVSEKELVGLCGMWRFTGEGGGSRRCRESSSRSRRGPRGKVLSF